MVRPGLSTPLFCSSLLEVVPDNTRLRKSWLCSIFTTALPPNDQSRVKIISARLREHLLDRGVGLLASAMDRDRLPIRIHGFAGEEHLSPNWFGKCLARRFAL